MRYVGLNLIAPGVAQCAMKKWIRGLLQLSGAIACILWMVVALAQIMIGNLYLAMNGKQPQVHILDVFIPMGVIILLWIYSFIDLFFFCNVEDQLEKEESNYQI